MVIFHEYSENLLQNCFETMIQSFAEFSPQNSKLIIKFSLNRKSKEWRMDFPAISYRFQAPSPHNSDFEVGRLRPMVTASRHFDLSFLYFCDPSVHFLRLNLDYKSIIRSFSRKSTNLFSLLAYHRSLQIEFLLFRQQSSTVTPLYSRFGAWFTKVTRRELK